MSNNVQSDAAIVQNSQLHIGIAMSRCEMEVSTCWPVLFRVGHNGSMVCMEIMSIYSCCVQGGLFTTPEKNVVAIFFFVLRNLYAQQFVQLFYHTKRCMIMMAVRSLSQII